MCMYVYIYIYIYIYNVSASGSWPGSVASLPSDTAMCFSMSGSDTRDDETLIPTPCKNLGDDVLH